MELHVRQVCQTSSGGDHVTIYDAGIDLVPGVVRVDVLATDPPDANPKDVSAAVDAIRAGAERVLLPRGTGAVIRVRRLVIHLVDFKPWRFERHTTEELARLLAGPEADPS